MSNFRCNFIREFHRILWLLFSECSLLNLKHNALVLPIITTSARNGGKGIYKSINSILLTYKREKRKNKMSLLLSTTTLTLYKMEIWLDDGEK